MFGLRNLRHDNDLLASRLYSQDDFYQAFERDLAQAHQEVIIESPFLSPKRLNHLLPLLRRLERCGVNLQIK